MGKLVFRELLLYLTYCLPVDMFWVRNEMMFIPTRKKIVLSYTYYCAVPMKTQKNGYL